MFDSCLIVYEAPATRSWILGHSSAPHDWPSSQTVEHLYQRLFRLETVSGGDRNLRLSVGLSAEATVSQESKTLAGLHTMYTMYNVHHSNRTALHSFPYIVMHYTLCSLCRTSKHSNLLAIIFLAKTLFEAVAPFARLSGSLEI